MGKPKAGEVTLVKKRVASVTPKKAATKRSVVKEPKKKPLVKEQKNKKKIVVTAQKDDVRKIEIIKNIVKRRPLEPAAVPERSLLVSRISLALLIPFKSLDNTQAMSNVARYAGTMFVVLGAFFTLYNMSSALYIANEPMAAETISSTCSSGWCPDSETTTVTQTTEIDPCSSGWCMPTADIRVESSSNTLKETVPVTVTVAKATSVYLQAYNINTKRSHNIGAMTKGIDAIWRTKWVTTNLDDGTYRLDLIIVNDYAGTYTNNGAIHYVIANHPVDTTSTIGTTATTNTTLSSPTSAQTVTTTTSSSGSGTTNTTTSITDSTTTNTTSVPQPIRSATISDTSATSGSTGTVSTTTTTATAILTPTTNSTTTPPTTLIASSTLPSVKVELGMSEPLKGGVDLKTFVTGASSVRVYARPLSTTVSNLLGYAWLHSTGEWRFKWDTTRLPNGEYDLKVQAIFPDKTSNTRTISDITIKNDLSTATTTVTSLPLLPPRGVSTTSLTTAFTEPSISINVAKTDPLLHIVDLYISVSGATYVELHARPTSGAIPRFLGLAERQSDTSWRYRFDTTELPNMSYELYAKAGIPNRVEPFVGGHTPVRIENPAISTITPKEQEYVETLRSAGAEVEKIAPMPAPINTTQDSASDDEDDTETVSIAPSPYNEIRDQFEEEHQEKMNEVIDAFRADLGRILQEYSKALRNNDTETTRSLQNELEQIRARAIEELPIGEGKEDVITQINESLGTIIKDLRERTERSETLIKERVGEAVTKDSDRDGISDYDEVNLYGTDPFSADTDNDGFIDGVEVLNGYDPKDSVVETTVQYESPQEQGIVREDLLTVDHITTIKAEQTEKTSPKAYLAGKALPNSFVTLYMFSTPIVVTVKADSSGNWSYLFDKELENGSHEVYVGITDNAGRIVAKSNPLSFVKTAEAFTPVDAEASAVVSSVQDQPSLMSRYALLIFGSLAVVSLGLVLILLGLHVRPKEEDLQFA